MGIFYKGDPACVTLGSHVMVPLQAHLPFAVVGSTEEVKVGNKLVRARQYPWGVVQGECGGRLELDPYSVPCPDAWSPILLSASPLPHCLPCLGNLS